MARSKVDAPGLADRLSLFHQIGDMRHRACVLHRVGMVSGAARPAIKQRKNVISRADAFHGRGAG